MIFLIDFDDTICNTKYVDHGRRMGPPNMGAVDSVRRLHREHTVIIFTGRQVNKPAVYKAVADWMHFFQIPYDQITNIKPFEYDVIIDNRAMHFDGWPKVMARLNNLDIETWAYEGDNLSQQNGNEQVLTDYPQ